MIKKNIEYLAFDDRKFMLFGIPILSTLIHLVFFQETFSEIIEYGFSDLIEGVIYTFINWQYCRFVLISLRKRYTRFDQTKKRIIIKFLVFLSTIPILTVLASLVVTPIMFFFFGEDPNEPTFVQGLSATYFVTLSMVLFYEVVYLFHKYKEALIEKNNIQLAHVQGQLDNLKNQINPHFLFNSLNTLLNLIPPEAERATDYLIKLSKFYRYTVSSQQDHLTDLKTELENAKVFAELLQVRFFNAIAFEFPAESYRQYQVVPLCLQLLIENAIKHNIVSRESPLSITVELDEEEGYIYVKNKLQIKNEAIAYTGIGLENIKKRAAFFTDKEVRIEKSSNQFIVGVPLAQPIKIEDHAVSYH